MFFRQLIVFSGQWVSGQWVSCQWSVGQLFVARRLGVRIHQKGRPLTTNNGPLTTAHRPLTTAFILKSFSQSEMPPRRRRCR